MDIAETSDKTFENGFGVDEVRIIILMFSTISDKHRNIVRKS